MTRQVHNDWVESFDWGVRCLICGNAITNKRRNFWRRVTLTASWFLWVMGTSLMLSAIVLLTLYLIHGRNLIAGDGLSTDAVYDWFWILAAGFLGTTFLYQRQIIFTEEERKWL